MKKTAIYTITNTVSGKIYVGSSQHVRKRLSVHRWKLRRGNHDNIALQRAWDKNGEAAFIFTVVEEVADLSLLIEREQFWIDKLATSSALGKEGGYNFCPVAGSRRGSKQPPHVAEISRLAHLGKPKTAEHRARISAARKGQRKSGNHIEKLRAAAVKQFSDPKAREQAAIFGRLSGAPFKGRHHSPAVIEQLRQKALARYALVPKKPRKKYPYIPIPPDEHKKRGPERGTPRQDRRGFTDEQVREIRALKANGMSYGQLGKRFGIGPAPLHRIVHRQTYANIE